MDQDRTFVAKRNRGRIVYVPVSFLTVILGGVLLDDNSEPYIEVPVIEGIPAEMLSG